MDAPVVDIKSGQPLKAGRKKKEWTFIETWHDDREAQAEAILYLASLTEEYASSGGTAPER